VNALPQLGNSSRRRDLNNEQLGIGGSWLLGEPSAPLRGLSAGKRHDAKKRSRWYEVLMVMLRIGYPAAAVFLLC